MFDIESDSDVYDSTNSSVASDEEDDNSVSSLTKSSSSSELISNDNNITSEILKRLASDKLFSGMNKLRQEDKFCDAVLKVNGTEFRVHKNMLSAFSPYFNGLFSGNFRESNDSTITLNNFDSDALELIINFIYTAQIRVNKHNVQMVLDTAHFLQIDLLQVICIRFLCRDINEENCLEFLSMSAKYGNEKLLKRTLRELVKNFFTFYVQNDLLKIELYQLKKLLLQNFMRTYPDNFVMNLIIRWVENDYDERKEYLDTLLYDYILSIRITKEQFNKFKKIAIESDCIKWIKDFEHNFDQVEQDCYHFTFNHLGNYDCHDYHVRTGQSYPIPRENLYPGASYTQYNNSVLVHGGWENNDYVKSSLCYNIFTSSWRKFIPMNIARAYHRTCVLNDHLYIVGGGYTTRSINDVEMMDLITGNKMIARGLINARSSMGIGTYENSIYAVAGINGEQNLNTIERYDPREDGWDLLSARTYGYGYCSSAVTLDNVMYCAMGPGKSMDRFDFRMNQWTQIKTQYDKYPNELFKYDDTLFGVFRNTVCRYDPFNGSWHQFWSLDGLDSDYTLAMAFSSRPQAFRYNKN